MWQHTWTIINERLSDKIIRVEISTSKIRGDVKQLCELCKSYNFL